MFYEDARCLAVPLPEDLAHLKHFGDFTRMERVLDLRISDPGLPEALRVRLRLEKDIIRRLPREYPDDFDHALAMLQAEIRGYTAAELERARDLGMVDWIYVNGQVRFAESFLSTLLKVRPELESRLLHPERVAQKRDAARRLDDVIREVRERGGAARRWRMRHTLRVRKESVREGVPLRVHLPLPLACDPAGDFRLLKAWPGEPYVAAPDAPQRTAYFCRPLSPGEEFGVEYEFTVRAPYRPISRAARESGGQDFRPEDAEALAGFLREQPPHIAFTPLIREVAAEIAGNERNPLRLARAAYDFLTRRPIYSFVRNYFTYPDLPGHMLTAMKGDCGIFALSFITLCRCLGVPARWQSGLFCAPGDVGCHDWAEFYCRPWGWLPVDASFGNSAWRAGSEERCDFYFGNLDPFRLPAAREFQAPFDPPKRFLRWDPYDNQMGEAEYEDENLARDQLELRCEMIGGESIPYDP